MCLLKPKAGGVQRSVLPTNGKIRPRELAQAIVVTNYYGLGHVASFFATRRHANTSLHAPQGRRPKWGRRLKKVLNFGEKKPKYNKTKWHSEISFFFSAVVGGGAGKTGRPKSTRLVSVPQGGGRGADLKAVRPFPLPPNFGQAKRTVQAWACKKNQCF